MCRFEYGRLGGIMGADKAGKSSLLNALGGQYVSTSTLVSGNILYDTLPLDKNTLPWQRCAFVESLDEQLRDLTVHQILTYAMQLRCNDYSELKSVDINVTRTVELFQLQELVIYYHIYTV
jgi:ABC-type multidrug transport system ATPase subunit